MELELIIHQVDYDAKDFIRKILETKPEMRYRIQDIR
jgi:hypothetical protein